jgi:hypothetical protein
MKGQSGGGGTMPAATTQPVNTPVEQAPLSSFNPTGPVSKDFTSAPAVAPVAKTPGTPAPDSATTQPVSPVERQQQAEQKLFPFAPNPYDRSFPGDPRMTNPLGVPWGRPGDNTGNSGRFK